MMHPSLNYRPTPPSQLPYVPSARGFRPTGHRVDLGFVPREPAPPPQYRPMPDGTFFDPTARVALAVKQQSERLPVVCTDGSRGPGCGRTFYPRHSDSQRCPTCRPHRWHAANKATRARAARSHAARRKVA